MQKLAMSKKIMDKHNRSTKRTITGIRYGEKVNATYNIPENKTVNLTQQPQQPQYRKRLMYKPVSQDAVINSKLPDEIKKLMLKIR